MQGTAADFIKRAMIVADRWIVESGADVRMIMQVHDELVFEVHTAALAETTARIRRCMAEVATLSVPLVVDIGVGVSWGMRIRRSRIGPSWPAACLDPIDVIPAQNL